MTIPVSSTAPELIDLVRKIAEATDRPFRPFQLQALLQLPQCANAAGMVDPKEAASLLGVLALELPHRAEWIAEGNVPRASDFVFSKHLPADEENRVMLRFHYLRSPRTDGHSYGLFSRSGRLVAMCYISPLDVPKLADLLDSSGFAPSQAKVVSRVFAFEDAPRNTISYLLARVANAEKTTGATSLVTYVNPFMGFTGISYIAAGWHFFGQEAGTKCRYLDGRYITDRELANRYGRHDDATYRTMLGERFAVSVMELPPLLVFWNRLV